MYFHLFIFFVAFVGLGVFKEVGSPQQKQRARRNYIILLMFFLAIQSGFRNLAVGADTLAYYYKFEAVKEASFGQLFHDVLLLNGKDPGYAFLSKVFSSVIPSFRFFLISIAAFFFTALGKLLYRYLSTNWDVFISIALYECLYYGFFSITGIRQTIATAILLFSLFYILKDDHRVKNTLIFLVMLVIASTIHKSSFLFLPICFLPRISNNRILFIVAFIMFIPMFSFGPYIGDYLKDTDFEQYAHYMQQNDTNGARVFILYIVLLVTAVLFKRKVINSYSQYNCVFTSAVAIAMLLSPLLMLDPNNQRIVQYYSIFGLIVLPQICRAYSNSSTSKALFLTVFAILAIYTVMRHEPYAFFWQDMSWANTGQIINDNRV